MNLDRLLYLVPRCTGASFGFWPLPGGWRLDAFYLRPAHMVRRFVLETHGAPLPESTGCDLHLVRVVDERGVELARAWRMPATATVYDLLVEVAASRGLRPMLEDGRLELVTPEELERRLAERRARFQALTDPALGDPHTGGA